MSSGAVTECRCTTAHAPVLRAGQRSVNGLEHTCSAFMSKVATVCFIGKILSNFYVLQS